MCLANIRASDQYIGRYSHGYLRRRGSTEIFVDAHGFRQSAEENGQSVFGLGDAALINGYGSGGDLLLDLGLVYVQFSDDAFVKALLDDVQAFLPRFESRTGDGQTPVGIQQLVIGGGDIGDQGQLHDLETIFSGHQFGPRRFSGPFEFAPEVDLPGQRSSQVNG